MSDELPKCRLCLVPYGVRHPRTCPLWDVLLSEADWRRLHGPQPEMTGARLGDVLVRAGVIDAAAVEDPDGYDGGQTVDALAMAARELAMPLNSATNTAELATAMPSAPPSRRHPRRPRGAGGCGAANAAPFPSAVVVFANAEAVRPAVAGTHQPLVGHSGVSE